MGPPTPEPLPDIAEIVAYSRRQAMDWSLVLASQGIEATITCSPERQRWILLIEPHELERARESIRLYRAENRGWSWRKELPGADLELHWGAIVFCVILALIHSFGTYQAGAIFDRGMMDSVKVSAHEWWRFFTAVFLHEDLAHLAANVSFGLIVLGLAMGRYGAGLALLSTFFGGAIGNVSGWKLYSHQYTGLGASGMMMAALGMLTVHSVSLLRINKRAARFILGGVAGGFAIFLLEGLNPSSDVIAHVGGFVSGLTFGTILALLPTKVSQSKALDGVALFFFVTISALVWILALR